MTSRSPPSRALTAPVVTLCLARMLEAMGNGFIIIAIPISVAALPHPLFPFDEAFRVGLTVSVFGLVLGISQPIVGKWSSRYDLDRQLLLLGLSCFAAATAALSWAATYWQLLALRTLQGLFMALVIPATLALIARHSSPLRRGTAMGFYGMTRTLGFGLGPIFGGGVLLVTAVSHGYLIATLPAILAGLMLAFGPPRPGPRGASTVDARPSQDVGERLGPDPGLGPFLVLGFGLFVAACALSLMIVLENDFMRRLDQTTFEFGVAFAALVIVRIGADLAAGRMSDRVGRKPLIVRGMALLGPLTVLMAYAPSTESLTLVRVLMGLAMAGVSAPTFALASDRAPAHLMAARFGWVTAGFSLGLAFGPLATGVLAGAFSFETPFWVFGLLCVVAAAVLHIGLTEVRKG